LAESRFYARKHSREITDCAGLVRWSYAQALAAHDTLWTRTVELPVLPAMPSVKQHMALGSLFQTGEEIRDGSAFFVSRDIAAAEPGDLLFWRHTENTPAHIMIYI